MKKQGDIQKMRQAIVELAESVIQLAESIQFGQYKRTGSAIKAAERALDLIK